MSALWLSRYVWLPKFYKTLGFGSLKLKRTCGPMDMNKIYVSLHYSLTYYLKD